MIGTAELVEFDAGAACGVNGDPLRGTGVQDDPPVYIYIDYASSGGGGGDDLTDTAPIVQPAGRATSLSR